MEDITEEDQNYGTCLLFWAHEHDDVMTSFFILCDPLQFNDAMPVEYHLTIFILIFFAFYS